MQLSRRSQYGLRAVICLADAYQHGYLQTRELIVREDLPSKFLESILASLTRDRLLESRIGASGGYRLARSPKHIFLHEILASLEGRKLIDYTPEGAVETTPGEVAVGIVQNKLADSIRNVLDTLTLDEIMEQIRTGDRKRQMYYI